MGRFDLGALLQQQQNVPAEDRDIETVTREILKAQRVGGEAILTIGRGLIEAKTMLKHGEWLSWLAEKVGYSERTAQGFMRLARKYSNPQLVADLGVRKALALLALPDPEREEFLAETHQVDGEEKKVIDMTSRQLEQAIRERDEALAEKKQAEQSRRKMEADMKLSSQLLESARQEARGAEEKLTQLTRELETLKAAPVEVEVMEVDQSAIDQARAEAVAEMQAKLDKAREAKKKSDEKREQAEAAVETLKLQLEEAAKVRNQTAAMADPDVAKFEVYFNQAQEVAHKLRGLLLKARGREDQAAADRLTQAMLALGDKIKEAAQ